MQQRQLVSSRDGSLGRALAQMVNPPRVRQMGGPALAAVLMTAQLGMGERLQVGPKQIKPTSAQRRAAKIAAGRLKVDAAGRLVGA